MRVSTVNDDISWLRATFGDNSLDEIIDSLASLERNVLA